MYYDGNWDDPFVLVGDVDTEVRQWHAHQLKREDTLRRIETDTIDELSDFWKQHEKKRTQLIENHVSGLSVLFLSKGYKCKYKTCTHGYCMVWIDLGMQLRDCDRILREHAQSRKKLREELEASRLIQMAKFQARLDQHKERLSKEEARNQELHTRKREMERKILEWACIMCNEIIVILFQVFFIILIEQGRQREFIRYWAYGTVSQRCCWSSKKAWLNISMFHMLD